LDNNGVARKVIGVGTTPTGVAVDANGKVWVTCYDSDNVMRINPTGGADALGAVDLTVSLGTSADPYNYSDMTGNVLLGAVFQGSWDVVQDSGINNTQWGILSWTSAEPDETSIEVYVRADNNPAALPGKQFVQVQNGISFCQANIAGRYLEVLVVFEGDLQTQVSPVLYDITVASCDTVAPKPGAAYQMMPTGYIATLSAQDNCDNAPKIWVTEPLVSPSPSLPFSAGPFVTGDKIVVRVNPIQQPFFRPMAAPYKGLLQVRVLPNMYARDVRGNTSPMMPCHP
jgi:hypothetical protein